MRWGQIPTGRLVAAHDWQIAVLEHGFVDGLSKDNGSVRFG